MTASYLRRHISMPLYLWIEVEKSRETRLELFLDLVFGALESVHGDMRLPPIFQFDGCRADLRDLIGGQQTQTVHQCQVCHPTIVSHRMCVGGLCVKRGD